MYKTEGLLNQIAVVYKQFPDDSVKEMLTEFAKRMRNISKGGMISNTIIDKAFDLKDELMQHLTDLYLLQLNT
jgi:hypothetical protein